MALRSDGYEREGREHETRREWKGCGRAMLAAAESLPAHPRHAQRLASAAQCFQKARLVGQALQARVALISAHPGDSLVRDALFDVAAAYHQLAYYTKAAACYEAFATAFPRDKRAAKALENVSEFREAVRDEAEDCIPGVDFSRIGGQTHSGDREGER
jgi:TolA-binding protein